MILYSDKDYKGRFKTEIDNLLGDSISIKEQMNKGTIGSELYRLKKLKIKEKIPDFTDLNSRCNFQKYKKGLLLRINHNMSLFNIAISYDKIESVDLIKGDENISPFFFSPMRLLLSLGVHVRYARYFKIHLSEYSIEPMFLKITSGDDFIELDSSGWNYYGEIKYFKNFIKQ